jgi:hypothetical protein
MYSAPGRIDEGDACGRYGVKDDGESSLSPTFDRYAEECGFLPPIPAKKSVIPEISHERGAVNVSADR